MNQNTEPAQKQIWQLTLAEFLAAEPTTGESVRAVSFPQWLAANDYPAGFGRERNTLFPQLDYAFNQNRTRAQKGKAKGAYERADSHNQERRRLLDCYASEVPATTQSVKLDLSRESDCAAARVMHRRAIRQAIAAGFDVPPEVLSEAIARYPELAAVKSRAESQMTENEAPPIFKQAELNRIPRQLAFDFA